MKDDWGEHDDWFDVVSRVYAALIGAQKPVPSEVTGCCSGYVTDVHARALVRDACRLADLFMDEY